METRALSAVIKQLNSITNLDKPGAALELRDILDVFFKHPKAKDNLEVLFRIFERFPEDSDSYFHVFWGMMHRIESQGVEVIFPELLASMKRQPSDFGLRMAGGIMNYWKSDAPEYGLHQRFELLKLVTRISQDAKLTPRFRERARRGLFIQAMSHPDWPWSKDLGNPSDIADAIYQHPEATASNREYYAGYVNRVQKNERKLYSVAVQANATAFLARHGLIAEKAKDTKSP